MLRRIVTMLSGLFAAGGCSSSHDQSLPSNQPGSFALTEIDSKGTSDGTLKIWRAPSRATDGEPFDFRLEMLLKTPKGDVPFAFSKGAIIREPGANGTRFLMEIARAIEADGDVASQAERAERLDFSTAILGTSLTREAGDDIIGGRFTSTKSGDWIAFKLFLADGEGEVYLNVNPVIGEGEFTTKDPEYGEIVLRELAKVFYP